VETKWILKLIDEITAPLRAIQGHADETADSMGAITNQANEVQGAIEDIADPVKQASKAVGGLTESIKDSEVAAGTLKQNIDAVKNTLSGYKAKLAVETDPDKIRAYETMVEELKGKLKELEHLPDPGESGNNWGKIALAANQAYEITEKLVEALDFTVEISNLQTDIERFTGKTGDDLDKLTRKTWRLARIFGEDAEEIARAANAMTKQIGGSFEENLDLIQQGYEKGANLNKDMLEQLKEYGPQLKAAGITGAQGIALMVKAGKDGVFSDKAIDAIKEANLSLRELGQPQIDALHALGLKVKDIAGKTAFEASQMIAKAMETAPIQAKQMALTDIFKGAGEDAGLNFIEGLASVDMDINNNPSIKQAGESTKGFLADMQSWFATTFSGVATSVTVMGSVGAALAGFTPVFIALKESQLGVAISTKIATAAQWLWNAALDANPIGAVILAIVALVGMITYAWTHFEGFREVVFGLWEVFKTVFGNIAGLFKAVFGPIGEAIQAIKEGRYMDAAKAALKLNPVSMLVTAGQYIANGGMSKGLDESLARGKAKGKASWDESQQDKAKNGKPEGIGAGTSYTNGLDKNKPGTVTLDGKLFNPKTGTMGGSGLEMAGSGAGGGGKSLTMTLNITNNFHGISSKLDVRKVADEVVGHINDRLRDALITTG
jgi:phage-related minor tail protein